MGADWVNQRRGSGQGCRNADRGGGSGHGWQTGAEDRMKIGVANGMQVTVENGMENRDELGWRTERDWSS